MILIKKNTNYIIESSNSNILLTADLTTDTNILLLDGLVLSADGNFLGRFSYLYVKNGESSKTIYKILREFISSVDTLLEETISYLILRFNMS